MMTHPHQPHLFARLDDIVLNLKKDSHVIALITLGSVGLDTHRLDAFSDLDFFVITEDGYAQTLINDSSWLVTSSPLAFIFQNTPDGFKLLYQDGIYGECAIFDQSRLKTIPYHHARLYYLKEGSSLEFTSSNTRIGPKPSRDYLLNEALTNLYVGLLRYQRGEVYSAYRFISQYALTSTLNLALYDEIGDDPFDISRRIEKHHPSLIPLLKNANQGYENVKDSALTLVDYLSSHFTVNEALLHRIKALI